MVTTTEVEMAYRLILGREPESEKVVAKHAIPNRTLDDLRRSFLTSEEFGVRFGKLTTATPNDMGCKPLVWTTIQVEVDVSAEHLAKMVERIEREFKHMGETEPHWSVISAEQFKSENIQDNKSEFFESQAMEWSMTYVPPRRGAGLRWTNSRPASSLAAVLGGAPSGWRISSKR